MLLYVATGRKGVGRKALLLKLIPFGIACQTSYQHLWDGYGVEAHLEDGFGSRSSAKSVVLHVTLP